MFNIKALFLFFHLPLLPILIKYERRFINGMNIECYQQSQKLKNNRLNLKRYSFRNKMNYLRMVTMCYSNLYFSP